VGGLEAVAHALAVQLAGRGHEVRVLTNRYPRDLPRHEVRDGIDVQRALFLAPRAGLLARWRLDLWLASLPLAPAAGRRLRRLVEEFRPDVVNVHFPDAMIPFVLALRPAHRFRLVVSLHGHEVMRFGGAAARRDCRALCRLLREADAVTACSGDLLDAAARLEPAAAARGVVIHNGIDPARFEDATRFAHPRPYVLALGRLTHKKGFDLLLEALARVAPDHPGVDLVLAGEGEERPSLEAAAARLGLDRRVHFFGKASPAEVVRLLNGCLFAAVPSRAEPFGIVALEALAAGRPVLATRVGGMAEFLESLPAPAPVVLVRPDPEALAEGLRTGLRDGWPAPGGPALTADIFREYSWSRVSRQYETVLAGRARVPATSGG
jgi:glycosyltransferase involved in cell wall biosynthesis